MLPMVARLPKLLAKVQASAHGAEHKARSGWVGRVGIDPRPVDYEASRLIVAFIAAELRYLP
jgi:hypothetical protein